MKNAEIGDAIIDRYLEAEVTRISPEAPVPVYKIVGEKEQAGGAANVFENVKGFFPDAKFYGNQDNPIIKVRVVSNNHYLGRLDFEDPKESYNPIHFYDLNKIVGDEDAFIVSDYNKGFVTPQLMDVLRGTGKPIYMAGKHRYYGGMELLVLNKSESLPMKRYMPEPPKYYVVTAGKEGVRLIRSGTEYREEFPTEPRNAVDVTGAGDVFFAHCACHMINGCAIEEAIRLAQIAAGESVEQFGTTIIPPVHSWYPDTSPTQSAGLKTQKLQSLPTL